MDGKIAEILSNKEVYSSKPNERLDLNKAELKDIKGVMSYTGGEMNIEELICNVLDISLRDK